MGSIQPGIVHQIGIRGNSPHNSKPRYFEIIMGISIAFISAVAGNFTNSKWIPSTGNFDGPQTSPPVSAETCSAVAEGPGTGCLSAGGFRGRRPLSGQWAY